MKKLTLAISLVISSLVTLGQESNGSSEFLLYSNFDFQKSELIINQNSTNELILIDGFQIGDLAFAFRKPINEKWNRELLIQNIDLFSVTDEIVSIINSEDQTIVTHGFRAQKSSLGVGLEAHRSLGNSEGKLNFRLGGLTSINLSHLNFRPKISTSFPFRTAQFTADLSIVPRVVYRVNSRCDLSLSAFIPFVQLKFNHSITDQPRIPEPLRTTSIKDFDLFKTPSHFRFGIAYKLATKEKEQS